MTPTKASSIVTTIKIAAATESAQTDSAASTVRFAGAKSPKPMKRTASQKIKTIRNGTGIVAASCVNADARICAT
jgi:hypothetical protein